MRRTAILVSCVALALLVTASVVPRFAARRRAGEKPARVLTVHKGDLRVVVREMGTVEALTKVEVKSKVGGRILSVPVEEGRHVERGQLLAKLDRTETQSQVNQIQAQIAASRARLTQAETDLRYQIRTTRLAEQDAEQGLHAARARLAQSERQSRVQPALTRSAIQQAEANTRAADAALAVLQSATHPQTSADARAALDQAQTNADNAGRQLQRMRALLARGFVPQNQVDDAQRDYDNACAQREAARQRMETMQERLAAERHGAEAQAEQMRAALDMARSNGVQDALRADDLAASRATFEQARLAQERCLAGEEQIASRRAEVTAARAGVKQLEDQLAEVSVRLQDATILAPMAGTVTKRYIEAGELVTSGIATFSSGMPIVQIADLSRMRVVCEINEVDVARVRVGQGAEILLDAARGQHYPGRVVSVAPAALIRAPGEAQGAASSIVKFVVKIAVLRTDGGLKPGMSAAVNLIVGERRGVLVLPLEAVDMGARPPRVKLLHGESVTAAPVTTGLQNETSVEIRSGLREGDRALPAAYHGVARRGVKGIP